MYERYHFDEKFVCKFRIETEKFSSLDDYLFQQIILYTAALYAHNHEESIESFQSQSMSMIAASLIDAADIPELRIAVSSPGYIVVINGNIIPLVAGALMVLAASAGPTLGLDQAHIEVVNSADNSVVSAECQADIAREVMSDVKAMGYSRWQEVCELEVKARERSKISPGMGVSPPSTKP